MERDERWYVPVLAFPTAASAPLELSPVALAVRVEIGVVVVPGAVTRVVVRIVGALIPSFLGSTGVGAGSLRASVIPVGPVAKGPFLALPRFS